MIRRNANASLRSNDLEAPADLKKKAPQPDHKLAVARENDLSQAIAVMRNLRSPPKVGQSVVSKTALKLQRSLGNQKIKNLIDLRLAASTPRAAPVLFALSANVESKRKIQRVPEKILKPGWGNTFLHDDSWLLFAPAATVNLFTSKIPVNFAKGGVPEEVQLPEGADRGTVAIRVEMSWFRNVWSGNQEGSGAAWVTVPFKVSVENKIEWDASQPTPVRSYTGSGASVTLPGPVTAAGDSVSMIVEINGAGTTTTGWSASGGGSYDGAQGGVQGSSTVTTPTGASEARPYTVKLKLPPKPAPERLSRTCVIPFAVNSARVEDKAQTDFVVWYKSELTKEMRDSIETGATTVWIKGFASTTNSIEYNRKLTDKRATNTLTMAKSYMGTRAKIELQGGSFGDALQFDTSTGQKTVTEDMAERRAEISVVFEPTANKPMSGETVPSTAGGTPIKP